MNRTTQAGFTSSEIGAAEEGGRGATILIVEDSRIQAELLRRTIAMAGYQTLMAKDGAEGLALARAHRPAAVVSDITMPVMNGFELCQRLRQEQELRETPVILLTALSDPLDVIRGLNAGADCYVTKPYDGGPLLSRLAALIAEPPARDQAPIEMEARVSGTSAPVLARAQQVLDLLISTYENSVLQQHHLTAAQDALVAANATLDQQVQKRTRELEQANADLAREIDERKDLQQRLQRANAELNASVRKLRRRNNQLALLDKMGNLLQACLTLEDACEIVQDSASQLLPSSPGLLALADDPGGRVSVVAHWGGEHAGARAWSQDRCRALRTGAVQVSGETDSDDACAGACEAKSAGSLCVPLKARGRTLGLLHMQGAFTPRARGASGIGTDRRLQFQLVDAAAVTIALAIANIRLQENLRQQSLQDPLTGLYNRRFLGDALEREAARARRSGRPLGLIMLDIDNFKRINDVHGHVAGDLVLKWLGRYLRDGVRGEDLACRYGGEEFLLLVPGATLENAALRAEQIRAGVEAGSGIDFEGQTIGPITVSLGVAALYLDDADQARVAGSVQAADDALLRAKQQGRNRVVLADPGCGKWPLIALSEKQVPGAKVSADTADTHETGPTDHDAGSGVHR